MEEERIPTGFEGRTVAEQALRLAGSDLRNWRTSVEAELARRGGESAAIGRELFADQAWANLDRILAGFAQWSELSRIEAVGAVRPEVGPVQQLQYEMLGAGLWRMLTRLGADQKVETLIASPADCLAHVMAESAPISATIR